MNVSLRSNALSSKILQALDSAKLNKVSLNNTIFFFFDESDQNEKLTAVSALISGTLTAVESFLTISSGPEVASDNLHSCTA